MDICPSISFLNQGCYLPDVWLMHTQDLQLPNNLSSKDISSGSFSVYSGFFQGTNWALALECY